MPGTSHQIELQFLNNLSFAASDAAQDLLTHETLKVLLKFLVDGPNEFYKKNHPKLTDLEWNKTFRAVILAKLSYFEINRYFTDQEIDKWFEIAQTAFEMPWESPVQMYKRVEHQYPYFAKVAKTALLIKQQRQKKAQAAT
ncbi:hypothetical protein [Thiomicrospira sp. ALE5]|uniref:hypothetical protein n=1 Tax=Thiomicrospira sp. ALE5 TaxID=748650 RepID=UPI0008E4B6C3|nr:hypothetical protein [Thiomicrospira sp. ALE5]SFR53629.1 hypothetical protein SAMN03092900_0890 [Thiomicrospira sp. ALE5]